MILFVQLDIMETIAVSESGANIMKRERLQLSVC